MDFSYYTLSITGKNINRFIKLLHSKNINLRYINTKHNDAIVTVSYEDYKKILEIKTIYEIKIIKVKGINKFKLYLKKYNIFIIFFVMGIVNLYFLSNIIFRIDISLNNKNLKEQVINDLKIKGITVLSLKKSFNELENIKTSIKNKYKDEIEWLEIESKGVSYNIKIIERKKETIEKKYEYSNIVATKTGMIYDIYARSGELIKNKFDYVKKGDIIISGVIHKNEDVVSYTKSSGDVYGEVWYKISINYPLNQEVINTFGKKKTKYKLNIFGKDIISYNQKKYKSTKSKILLKNRIFTFSKEDVLEYKIIETKYSYDEAITLAKQKVKTKMKNALNEDEYIISEKTLKIVKENDNIYLETFFKVYQKISVEEAFSIEDIIKENEAKKE